MGSIDPAIRQHLIIVGTDFSATALLALSEGRALARRLAAECRVVHVRQLPPEGAWLPNEQELSWLDVTRVADFDVEVRRGTAWVELVRAATERGAELIVIGTHGNSGFQPLGLGSTAERLALLSPIPVVLVGSRERSSVDGPDGVDRDRMIQDKDGGRSAGLAGRPRRSPSKKGSRHEE